MKKYSKGFFYIPKWPQKQNLRSLRAIVWIWEHFEFVGLFSIDGKISGERKLLNFD